MACRHMPSRREIGIDIGKKVRDRVWELTHCVGKQAVVGKGRERRQQTFIAVSTHRNQENTHIMHKEQELAVHVH